MTTNSWRQEWPAHRVRLIDVTARYLVDGQARASQGELPSWNELPPEHQSNFSDTVAAVFVAQAQAFAEIEANIRDADGSRTGE
ncbi:hypothetical protein [Microbacterium sp. nov. GSS16]|uniref:hypothetical protein n=1 Tax=Microbacterium sp. nov. GSS16 TaxID=3019890 RepID=UPI002305933F|nr:hypothetical protein [Microbacterium sp. nov. GSS16]WCD91519.1 hypothetical protein PGB26_07335 [Microbacterium sp. nov. GSS16]